MLLRICCACSRVLRTANCHLSLHDSMQRRDAQRKMRHHVVYKHPASSQLHNAIQCNMPTSTVPLFGILVDIQYDELELIELQCFQVCQLAQTVGCTSSNTDGVLLKILLLLWHLHMLRKQFRNPTSLHVMPTDVVPS